MKDTRRSVIKATGLSVGFSALTGVSSARTRRRGKDEGEENERTSIGGGMYAEKEMVKESNEKVVERITIWDGDEEDAQKKTSYILESEKSNGESGSVHLQEKGRVGI